MAARLESIHWTDKRCVNEIGGDAKRRGVDYVVISTQTNAIPIESIQESISKSPSSSVFVFVDSKHPFADLRLNSLLPPVIRLMASLPEQDLATAVSVRALSSQSPSSRQSPSLCEFVVQMSGTDVGAVAFVTAISGTLSDDDVPSLSVTSERPEHSWLREIVDGIQIVNATEATLSALRAGLFLLNDMFDESHACSQSIEGKGRYHTGDYWHAILHRREPDYGNAKYWFRSVGKHPIFAHLAKAIESESRLESDGNVGSRNRKQVVVNGVWDPIAFIDMCSATEHDPALKQWCEQVQYCEMLLLLEHSYREAAGLQLG